jgi:hypothetical protein
MSAGELGREGHGDGGGRERRRGGFVRKTVGWIALAGIVATGGAYVNNRWVHFFEGGRGSFGATLRGQARDIADGNLGSVGDTIVDPVTLQNPSAALIRSEVELAALAADGDGSPTVLELAEAATVDDELSGGIPAASQRGLEADLKDALAFSNPNAPGAVFDATLAYNIAVGDLAGRRVVTLQVGANIPTPASDPTQPANPGN